jgi:type IV pilus assembly protein PilQ
MRTRILLLASLASLSRVLAQEEHTATITPEAMPAPEAAPVVVASPSPAPGLPVIVPVADVVAEPVMKNKDTLSVDFPDEEIRTVLRNVADLFELNLVIPDTLQGRTSLKLREVTWRQIFQVVLSPVGYAFVEDDNIIKIVSKDALSSEPFITSSIVLDNVAAISIEPLLRSILTPGRPATATSPSVQGGSIVVNALANELIITDQSTVVSQVKTRAKLLDLEPRQVIIETKFVELTKGRDKELAISLAGKQNFGGGSSVASGALNTLGQTLPTGGVATGSPSLGGTGTFNAVLDAKDYSLLLKAFDSVTGTRIVSNPTIVAINGSKSQINIGTDFQLVTATQTSPTGGGTPTVTYTAGEKVFEGVKVEVTPQITSNKLVTLALKTEKSNASAFTVGQGVTAQKFYDISKREGSLNMILKDGQTAAIGGLLDTKNSKTDTKVPILGDIPVLGNLFKSKSDSKLETNLIIFITASILEPSKTTYRNIATQQQVSSLDLTDRDIQGVAYKIPDSESQLYLGVDSARRRKQDLEIAAKLEAEKAASIKSLPTK